MQPGLSIYQHNSWGKGHGQLTAGGEDGNLDADPQRKALFGAGRTPRAAEGFRKVRKPATRRGRESGGPRCQYSPSDKLLKVCKLEAIETTISFLLGSWAPGTHSRCHQALELPAPSSQESQPAWLARRARGAPF